MRLGEAGRYAVSLVPERGGFAAVNMQATPFDVTDADLDTGATVELPIALETWTHFLEQAAPR